MFVARKILGWNKEEFMSATPRYYDEMLSRAADFENPKRNKAPIKKARTVADFRDMP